MHDHANDPATGIANGLLLSTLFWLALGVAITPPDAARVRAAAGLSR